MRRIEELMVALAEAERAVLAELERLYPKGCTVRYQLREGVKEQEGQVVGYIGGLEGKVRVRLAPGRSDIRDTRYETTMPFRKILERCRD